MRTVPILFIHYGNSSYLPYVINVAKRFNPHKDILFLGDEHNAYLRDLGVLHYPLEAFAHSADLARFEQLYPSIVNKRYAKTKWAHFVLKRWFVINTFIQQEKIEKFWTFDSDNFLLTDLTDYEAYFSQYDCTSQCKGSCLNGFVPDAAIVQRYVSKINELLSDRAYIEDWQRRYEENPALFYNEMEAFAVFVEQEGIKNFHLSQICNGCTFEDSITYVHDGMEMYEKKIKERFVKKLYLHRGDIYCKHLASNTFIKMNNLNLSWMPKYIFPLLHQYLTCIEAKDDFVPLDLLKAPLSYHVKFFISKHVPQHVRDRVCRGAYWV